MFMECPAGCSWNGWPDDVECAYSADRIGLGQPVRKPFAWRGGVWVCTGITHLRGEISAECYRLVPLRFFEGAVCRYRDRCEDGDAARNDPFGFYHGMIVSHGGQDFVLCGPPETFQPGEAEQLALF